MVRIRFSVWMGSCYAHVLCATLGCNRCSEGDRTFAG